MKLPRDINAAALIKALQKFGYAVSRQKGSHIRLTTTLNGTHHITIPNHNPLKLGTLSSIINEVALHTGKSKDEIADQLF